MFNWNVSPVLFCEEFRVVMNRWFTSDFNIYGKLFLDPVWSVLHCFVMPAYDVIDWLSPDSAFCSQLSTSNDDSLEIVSMPKTFDFQLFNSNLFRSEASSEEEPIKANCRRVFSSHSFSFFFRLLASHPRHQRRRSGRPMWKRSFQSKTWKTSFGNLMRTRLSPHMRLCWNLAGLMSEWNPTASFWRKRKSCTWKWRRAQM